MHPHRSSALGYASAASAAHNSMYGACAAEATASEALRLRLGGCIRAWTDFGPHPVDAPYISIGIARIVVSNHDTRRDALTQSSSRPPRTAHAAVGPPPRKLPRGQTADADRRGATRQHTCKKTREVAGSARL